MEALNFKVGSSTTIVATIDYSKLNELQNGKILTPQDIIKIVEAATEHELPQHDICEVDGRNKTIILYAHINWVKKL